MKRTEIALRCAIDDADLIGTILPHEAAQLYTLLDSQGDTPAALALIWPAEYEGAESWPEHLQGIRAQRVALRARIMEYLTSGGTRACSSRPRT